MRRHHALRRIDLRTSASCSRPDAASVSPARSGLGQCDQAIRQYRFVTADL
jgi:hypothetical protein